MYSHKLKIAVIKKYVLKNPTPKKQKKPQKPYSCHFRPQQLNPLLCKQPGIPVLHYFLLLYDIPLYSCTIVYLVSSLL